jgi:uncharacterized membrane protein YbhN (UPF0104 family)
MSVRAPSPPRRTRRRPSEDRRGGCPEGDSARPRPLEEPAPVEEPARVEEPTRVEEPARVEEPVAEGTGRARPAIGRRVATAGLLIALAISLLLSVPGLRPVVRAIAEIDPLWVVVAIALELASCVSFVIVFRLFFDRVQARDARALAWTSMASGALLPGGGVGGYAVGGWLAHLTGVPTRWIVRRSSGLFFFTSGINASAIIIAGLLLVAGVSGPHDFGRAALPALLAGAALVVVLSLPVVARRREGGAGRLEALIVGITDAWRAALRPSWRLLGALGYLGFDIAVLWVAFSAVGEPPSVPALVLGYSIGYLANSAPVPGGIGVLDAGLAGALLLYGASPLHVVAAVLVYHAVAFWIPSLGGVIAYACLRPRLTDPGRSEADPGRSEAGAARSPVAPPATAP